MRPGRLLLLLAALLAPIAAPAAEPLRIVTSFTILADLTQQVAGDRANVTSLVGPDGDAHGYEPTPTDVRSLSQADFVVVNGLGFEGWIDRLISASGYDGPIVTASSTVNAIGREGEHHDDDDDDHDHGHGHDHGHDDDHGNDDHRDHDHGAEDPHAWTSPREVRRYVEVIRDALIDRDPEHASTYRERASAYIDELDALDAWIRDTLESIPPDHRRAIVGHDSFAYFGRDYGIEFVSALGLSTDAEPSARQVGELIRQLRQDDVRVLFLESITDSRQVERIAADGNGHIGGALYSDALSPADGDAPDYIAMIRYNVEAMRAAFEAAYQDH